MEAGYLVTKGNKTFRESPMEIGVFGQALKQKWKVEDLQRDLTTYEWRKIPVIVENYKNGY
jgi:hypothetical protein